MGIIKSSGIIISVHESGETSRIVDVFTRQYGLMRVMAKGARRPESRFAASTEMLCNFHGVFYTREDDTMANLSGADVIRSFPSIHADLSKFAFASGWAEVLLSNLPPEEPHKNLFDVFLNALKDLEEVATEQNEKFFWVHLLKFLSLLGFRPEFMFCSGCHAGQSEDWMFSVENGRLYCNRCSRSLRDSLFIRLDGGEVKILTLFSRADKEVLKQLAISEKQMSMVREVIEGFRRYHTLPNTRLNSLEFMEKISEQNTEG